MNLYAFHAGVFPLVATPRPAVKKIPSRDKLLFDLIGKSSAPAFGYSSDEASITLREQPTAAGGVSVLSPGFSVSWLAQERASHQDGSVLGGYPLLQSPRSDLASMRVSIAGRGSDMTVEEVSPNDVLTGIEGAQSRFKGFFCYRLHDDALVVLSTISDWTFAVVNGESGITFNAARRVCAETWIREESLLTALYARVRMQWQQDRIANRGTPSSKDVFMAALEHSFELQNVFHSGKDAFKTVSLMGVHGFFEGGFLFSCGLENSEPSQVTSGHA